MQTTSLRRAGFRRTCHPAVTTRNGQSGSREARHKGLL